MSETWSYRGTAGDLFGQDYSGYRRRAKVVPTGPTLEERIQEAANTAGLDVPVAQHAEAITEVLENLRFPQGTEPSKIPDDFLEMAGVNSLGSLDEAAESAHTGVVLWNANGSVRDSARLPNRALSLVRFKPGGQDVVQIDDFSIGRVVPVTNKLDLSLARPVPPKQSMKRGASGIVVATFQPARGAKR